MAQNGSTGPAQDLEIQDAFSKLSQLEKDFMAVELDALRQKEYASRELYAKRSTLTAKIPSFWPEIFMSGALPAEIAATLLENDAEILKHIENLNVERYQIKSDTEGEPRSIRFTFEFSENKYFTDKKVVKDFEYKAFGDAPGGYVSKPVNFTWTKAAKKQGLNTMLDLANQLYQAEQAFAPNGSIEQKERESLWQYEKLREEIEKAEEEQADEGGHSFLEWFGYRGAVNAPAPKSKPANGNEEDDSEDDDDEVDEDDAALDVEIFPAGEEIAMAIAEELWPDAMDYYIQANTEDADEELDDDEEDAPDLVEAEDFDGFEEEADNAPPAKRRKR